MPGAAVVEDSDHGGGHSVSSKDISRVGEKTLISIRDHVSFRRGFNDSMAEQQPAPTESNDHCPSKDAGNEQLATGTAVGGHGRDTSNTTESTRSNSDQTTDSQFEGLLKRLSRFGSALTFVDAALVLGGFGSFMSSWSLWICWAIILLNLLMDFSIRPSWTWVTSYLRTCNGTPCNDTPCNGTPSSLNLSAADHARGEASFAFLKVLLASVLLVKVNDLGWSAGCSTYPCSHRAKESVRCLAVLVMMLEGVPLLLMGAVQARVDGVGIKRVKRSCHLLKCAFSEFWRDDSLTWLQIALILQSFHASASSAVLVSTAGLLVGGNFGNFMTAGCFWLCFSVGVVELLAEKACFTLIEMFTYAKSLGHHSMAASTNEIKHYEEHEKLNLDRITSKKGLNQANTHLKEEAIAKLILRVPIHAIIFICLIKYLHQKTYFPPGIGSNSCDELCKANTEALLLVVCIFSGSQVLSIFPLWAPLQILAALVPGFLVFGLFHILIAVLPIAMMGFLTEITLDSLLNSDEPIITITVILTTGYTIVYAITRWKRVSPLLHYTLVTPVLVIGTLLALFFESEVPGLVAISLLAIIYLVLLCNLHQRKTISRACLLELCPALDIDMC